MNRGCVITLYPRTWDTKQIAAIYRCLLNNQLIGAWKTNNEQWEKKWTICTYPVQLVSHSPLKEGKWEVHMFLSNSEIQVSSSFQFPYLGYILLPKNDYPWLLSLSSELLTLTSELPVHVVRICGWVFFSACFLPIEVLGPKVLFSLYPLFPINLTLMELTPENFELAMDIMEIHFIRLKPWPQTFSR